MYYKPEFVVGFYFKMNDRPEDMSFHYTDETMVKDLLKITPIEQNDTVLDPCSGLNKVWYNNFNVKEKYECEIEDGNNFFDWSKKVDWVIGNPPFHIGWKFELHALEIANKGIAWLLNTNGINSVFIPKRLEIIKNYGFYTQHIRVVSDHRWFGRYWYIIWTKQPNNFFDWELSTYSQDNKNYNSKKINTGIALGDDW